MCFGSSPANPVSLQVSRDRPIERCGECGNVVKLDYVGPLEEEHHREWI